MMIRQHTPPAAQKQSNKAFDGSAILRHDQNLQSKRPEPYLTSDRAVKTLHPQDLRHLPAGARPDRIQLLRVGDYLSGGVDPASAHEL